MTDPAPAAPGTSPGDPGPEAIRCPHCDEVTMPNLLSDGSYICSCAAERALPLRTANGTPWDGTPFVMPAPMDDPSYTRCGSHEHPMPPGDQFTATETNKREKQQSLPEDKAQFGRDITTESYEPLSAPPARSSGTGR
jgi:hypothetical protein